jgi:hypothetical protein
VSRFHSVSRQQEKGNLNGHETTIWRMRNACWIPKGRDTHSEHEIFIASPRQERLCERASMSLHTYIAWVCLQLQTFLTRLSTTRSFEKGLHLVLNWQFSSINLGYLFVPLNILTQPRTPSCKSASLAFRQAAWSPSRYCSQKSPIAIVRHLYAPAVAQSEYACSGVVLLTYWLTYSIAKSSLRI